MRSTAKGVTIQLDVPRKIRFDGEALLRLEEITGMSVLQVCRAFTPSGEGKSEEEAAEARAESFEFKLICQIVQAGLTDELPEVTTREVIKMMDENGKGEGAIPRILSYTGKVFAALSEATTGEDPKNVAADLEKTIEEATSDRKKKEKEKKKVVGTGASSSASA